MAKSKKHNGKHCRHCLYYDKDHKDGELPCKIGGIPESQTALQSDKEYCDAFLWSRQLTMF